MSRPLIVLLALFGYSAYRFFSRRRASDLLLALTWASLTLFLGMKLLPALYASGLLLVAAVVALLRDRRARPPDAAEGEDPLAEDGATGVS